MATPNLILNERQILHKIKRIAYQIYENNSAEEKITLAGVATKGYQLAEKLREHLQEISPLEVNLCKIEIDKENPLLPIKTSLKKEEYTNTSVILVDDVLNSGSTLIYSAKHFLEVPLKKLQTAVLVDRSHKKYPVKADFKGISLSTSLNETVKVIFENEMKVILV